MGKGGLVILLAEDDAAHAELVSRHLEGMKGLGRLVRVSDGQEALDYLLPDEGALVPEAPPRPDLVLLDLRLPKVDGLEVLRRMKGTATLRQIPVVVLTTSPAATDVSAAYERGASSYLIKPSDFAELQAMMGCLESYWGRWNRYPDA